MTPSQPSLSGRRRLPSAVIALGFTSFFTDVGTEMIFPLLPVFIASLGGSPAFLGLVEGLADAVSSVLKLVFGLVADRVTRRKPLVLAGYGIAAAVRPLMALATAPWQVLAVRLSDRVGKGMRSAPRDVLIANVVAKEETGRAFGFHQAMDHAGAVVGPLVATALLALGWNLRTVFAFALVPGILSLVAVLTVREKSQDAPAPEDDGRAPEATRLPRSLRSYLAILALFSLGNSTDAFLLLRARDAGVEVAMLPLLWAATNVAKLISAYIAGDWSDRVPRVKLIVSGWIVYAVAYLCFGFASAPWQAWVLFIVYGSYFGLTEPVEKALVKDLAPAAIRGRAFGVYNFVIGTSAVPAGLLTGWLWQTWSPRVALVTGAGIAAVSSVALLAWARGRLDDL